MYSFLKNFSGKIKIRCCGKGQLENKRAHGNYIYTNKYIYSIKEDKVKEISGKGEEIENMKENIKMSLRHCKS